MKLLEECPVPVAAIHRELERLGAGINRTKLDSWSAGRAFPSPEHQAALSQALHNLSRKVGECAVRVAEAERPSRLPEPKKGAGRPGRPRRETTETP